VTEDVAVRVRVAVSVPLSETDLGVSVAETPEGSPVTLRLIGPLKPFDEVTVTVVLLEVPLTSVMGDCTAKLNV
jgi:hypothetical protein